jgi:Dienelactone hydrolase family
LRCDGLSPQQTQRPHARRVGADQHHDLVGGVRHLDADILVIGLAAVDRFQCGIQGQVIGRAAGLGALDRPLAGGWPAQEAALKANAIRYEGHLWPNSVHGFFNDATPERYNKTMEPAAWTRTIEGFNQYVRDAPA